MTNLRRALASLALAAVALVGCASHTSEPTHKHLHTTITQPFNEGFADSKQDDCQQGFQPACAWLANNH